MAREQERQSKVIEKKVDAVKEELKDSEDEITRSITEMDNCFCLLIPKPEHTFGENPLNEDKPSSSSIENENISIDLREHGFSSATTRSIQIDNSNLGSVIKTEDNLPIIENLRDLHTLLKNRYLPIIKKWVAITSKSSKYYIIAFF